MSSLVAVYLRSNVNWDQLSEATYVDQDKYCNAVIPISRARKIELLERISAWNEIFSLSYFEYRQTMKEIADWNRSRIVNLDLVIKNHHHFEILNDIQDAIILPIDDDDWYSPQLAEKVRKYAPEATDLFYWNDAVFCPSQNTPRLNRDSNFLFPRNPHPDWFWTNAYAVTKRGLSKCPDEYRKDILDRHSMALRTFREEVSDVCVQHIPERLSVTHKSLASFTKLIAMESALDFESCISRLLERTSQIPADLSWAEPMIHQVDDLNEKLTKSVQSGSFKKKRPYKQFRNSSKEKKTTWLEAPLTRTNVINSIIQRFNYRSYLEIGCGNNHNFTLIQIDEKTGVDPNHGGTHRLSSDEFFKSNFQNFDIVFIDGLHLEEQVMRDVENSLKLLNDGGCILMHDCLPVEEVHQNRERTTGAWMGDVWKAVVKLRSRHEIDVAVLNRCCGMGVLLKRSNSDQLTSIPSLNWETFTTQKQRLLRILEPKELEVFLTTT